MTNPFRQGNDGEDRRIAQRARQQGGVRDIEIGRQPRWMKRFDLGGGQRQHPAGVAGIDRTQQNVFVFDAKAAENLLAEIDAYAQSLLILNREPFRDRPPGNRPHVGIRQLDHHP